MLAKFSIITLGASAPDRLIEQGVVREPLAAGSYSEYLAIANWDVRAHTVKFARPAAHARNPQNQRTLMAGLVKRAKRSWRRVGRHLREHAVRSSPPWLRRAAGPPASYLDMLLVDHGIFRFMYANSHRISEKAWRSAQPAPHQLRRFARAGIRTVVNLRGERECGSYYLERQACERFGMKLVNFQVRSRAAPTREELLGAKRLFEEVEYPMLMHCKSGADRAGLMSVLYRFLHEGAVAQVRAHPAGAHRHPRLLFRALPRRQRGPADAVLRVGGYGLRPRRIEA